MRNTKLASAAVAAALLACTPAAVHAQDAAVDTSYGNPQPEEEDGFPWGLLGLLGLLGLIPRKKHDRPDVDNRTRP